MNIADRTTAPFRIFYRSVSGEGCYACETCGMRRHDLFARAADVFAAAAQHLNLCRAALRHRPVEGTAILDGRSHGVVLRDGIMTLALHTLFGSGQPAVRVVT